jgi:hypothetical protein
LFVQWANKQFEDLDVDVIVSSTFTQKPVRKRKKMPGEVADDDPIVNVTKRFEVEVHNAVMDSILQEFDNRFSKHEMLYNSLELLDPRNFEMIATADLSHLKSDQLNGIAQLIPQIDISKFCSELTQFAREWPSLKNSTVLSEIQLTSNTVDDEDEDNIELADNAMTSLTKGCGADCLIGCLKVLVDYNLFSSAYETLYVVYKTVLTLPMTQVCCERSFSQLKMIKTRLRNALRQDNLEAYMLMKLNRQWTDEVDNQSIVYNMCENSEQFAKLLQL